MGGSRVSTSARGSLLGIGGAVVLIDDRHNINSVESDAERLMARTWWREISTKRLNDPKRAAIAIIMQRLHEDDVSGVILSSDLPSEWTHLMIPMQYESRRHCVASLGWQDPRGLDDDGQPFVAIQPSGERAPRDNAAAHELDKREGALMWPERFGGLGKLRPSRPSLAPIWPVDEQRSSHVISTVRTIVWAACIRSMRLVSQFLDFGSDRAEWAQYVLLCRKTVRNGAVMVAAATKYRVK